MDKTIYTATRIDQPRDFTIYGNVVSAQAGNYLLTDKDGNIQVVDAINFQHNYASAGTDNKDEYVEVKPKKAKQTEESAALEDALATADKARDEADAAKEAKSAARKSAKAAPKTDAAADSTKEAGEPAKVGTEGFVESVEATHEAAPVEGEQLSSEGEPKAEA